MEEREEKDWIVSVRLDKSEENRKRIALLMEHAWLKYGGKDGTMKTPIMSEWIRFLMNYYASREILSK